MRSALLHTFSHIVSGFGGGAQLKNCRVELSKYRVFFLMAIPSKVVVCDGVCELNFIDKTDFTISSPAIPEMGPTLSTTASANGTQTGRARHLKRVLNMQAPLRVDRSVRI